MYGAVKPLMVLFLLETFKSQFAQDETGIWTTHLTKMQIDMGDSEPVLQKPYPIAMKHYDWVRGEINKLLDAWVICNSHSSWSAPIIVVPKGDCGKLLVIDYRVLNKVMQKSVWSMPRGRTYFWSWMMLSTFKHSISILGIITYPLKKMLFQKTVFTSPIGKYEYLKVPFGLAQALAFFQELMNKVLKDLPFAIAYFNDSIIYSMTAKENLNHLQQVFNKLCNGELIWN